MWSPYDPRVLTRRGFAAQAGARLPPLGDLLGERMPSTLPLAQELEELLVPRKPVAGAQVIRVDDQMDETVIPNDPVALFLPQRDRRFSQDLEQRVVLDERNR
jgi:hypothetical protein